tara:strand:+ start:317 stop:481 length:165 start_codon:yes stop_codon:yes gene_type:complete
MLLVYIDKKLNNLFKYIKAWEITFIKINPNVIKINPNVRLSKVLISLKITAMQY